MADTPKNPQATAYLIIDTESVPDGRLLTKVKYPHQELAPEAAVSQAQAEARALSQSGSDFLPVSFQYPVAACVLRVAADFQLQALKCLDAPLFRPRKITEDFWKGVNSYRSRAGEPVQLDHLQWARFRSAAAGAGRVPLRRQCAGALQVPLSRRRWTRRPHGLDDQSRLQSPCRRP